MVVKTANAKKRTLPEKNCSGRCSSIDHGLSIVTKMQYYLLVTLLIKNKNLFKKTKIQIQISRARENQV